MLCMALTSPRTAVALRPWLVGELTARLALPVAIDRLDLDAFPPGLTVHGVALGELGGPV